MCTDVTHSTKNASQYAKRYGDASMWQTLEHESEPTWHVSGFDEPDLPVILNEDPDNVNFLHWAFMPFEFAPQIKGKPMNTLNARDDRIFTDKSIYRYAAKSRRCLVMLDGFFENYKKNDIVFPHYIQMKTKEPFMVGGLWQTFTDPKDEVETNTLALVTCPANKEMAWIHGETPHTPESRMFFIVDKKDDETWLHGSPEEAKALIKPLPDGQLDYYPCQPLKTVKKLNRVYMGNVSGLLERKRYKELE
ncbi:MAG: SOS response-associated peptidase family protein [Cyclobacteriaceae bacterium]